MSCLLTSNINVCPSSVPGVRKVWIGRYDDIFTYLYAAGGFSDIVQIQNFMATNLILYPFSVEGEVVNGTETLQDARSGVTFAQGVDLFFPYLDSDKRNTLEQLLHDRVIVIVQTKNGNNWLFGQEFGMKATAYTGTTGTTKSGNGYNVRLTSQDRFQIRLVDDSVLAGSVDNNGTGGSIPPGPGGPGPGPTPGSPITIFVGGNLPNGAISSTLNTWFSSGGDALPLVSLGNYQIQNFY